MPNLTQTLKDLSNSEVILLRAGEENESSHGIFDAPCSTTLLNLKELEEMAYIVDPGEFGVERYVSLINSLETFGFNFRKISNIYITHNHPDHIGAVSHFQSAQVILPDSTFKMPNGKRFTELVPNEFYSCPGNIRAVQDITKDKLKIVSTPGHSGWDVTIIYQNPHIKIAMVGDLFWSENDYQTDSEFPELCQDLGMQKRSRDYIIQKEKPDIIIPGHGSPFKL